MLRELELLEICRLPETFRAGVLSWHELVRKHSGAARTLSEEQLVSFLTDRADLIELWLAWSEDKRCSDGWFFQRRGSQFELGQVRGAGEPAPSQLFHEPAPACARFILRELAA